MKDNSISLSIVLYGLLVLSLWTAIGFGILFPIKLWNVYATGFGIITLIFLGVLVAVSSTEEAEY